MVGGCCCRSPTQSRSCRPPRAPSTGVQFEHGALDVAGPAPTASASRPKGIEALGFLSAGLFKLRSPCWKGPARRAGPPRLAQPAGSYGSRPLGPAPAPAPRRRARRRFVLLGFGSLASFLDQPGATIRGGSRFSWVRWRIFLRQLGVWAAVNSIGEPAHLLRRDLAALVGRSPDHQAAPLGVLPAVSSQGPVSRSFFRCFV